MADSTLTACLLVMAVATWTYVLASAGVAL